MTSRTWSVGAPPASPAWLRLITQGGPRGLVMWTIVIGTLVRIAFNATIGYGVGESYYVATARHFALSYFDQPPLSLWLTGAVIWLTGAGATLAVRLPFVLIFAGTTWLMFRLGARLFGEWAGAWSAVLLNLSPVFVVSVGGWVQPDALLFFFLLAAVVPFAELAFGNPRRPLLTWALTGAAFGLAMLSKYHAALTLAGVVIFIATMRGDRRWFFSKGLILAAAIAVAIFLPVLIWNWQNDWVSFVFQGERAGGTQIRFDWLARSILGQAVYLGLLLWPPLIFVFFRALRRGPASARYWFLCSLAILPIILFTVVALWAPLEWHFHWQAPGYMFLFPLLGEAVAARIERGDALTRRWVAISAFCMLLLLAGLGSQAQLGWVHWLVPKSIADTQPYANTNPTRELQDWNGLRDALAAKGLLGSRTFAVAASWIEVGKADVELGDAVPVVVLSQDPRNIAFGWDHTRFLGWDALIVVSSELNHDPTADFAPFFASVAHVMDFDVKLNGVTATTIHVYQARDYQKLYPLPYPGPAGR